jgi:hypothetical protein
MRWSIDLIQSSYWGKIVSFTWSFAAVAVKKPRRSSPDIRPCGLHFKKSLINMLSCTSKVSAYLLD